MASDKILLRRGHSSDLPGTPQLDVGEVAYITDQKVIAVGDGTSNPPLALTDQGIEILRNKVYVDQVVSSTGSASAYQASVSPSPSAYEKGLTVTFLPNHANTGATTLNLNSLGATEILDYQGNSLTGGELAVGAPTEVIHDGTNWRLISSIASSGTGEDNTASNLGGGAGLFAQKSNEDLQFKSLTSGSDVTITETSNEVQINFDSSNVTSGEDNTASNLGNGTGVFAQKNGVDLEFKSLVAGSNIILSSNSTEVTVSADPSIDGGAVGGEINSVVNSQVGYNVSTSMASSGLSVTSGDRIVITSAHVANIDANKTDGWVSARLNKNGGETVSLGYEIPVPGGSSVELFKRAKVLEPGDTLDFQADSSNRIDATITYSFIQSTTEFFSSTNDLTDTTMVDLHVASGDSVVESILIANDDPSIGEEVNVVWTDGTDTIQTYLVRNMNIGPNSTVEILEQTKYLPDTHKIRVQAVNNGNRLATSAHGKIK